MKSLNKTGIGQLIENQSPPGALAFASGRTPEQQRWRERARAQQLEALAQIREVEAARLALDPTPLRALAIAAAGATPGGAACARHSLPLCVRPSHFFGHPEGEN
jgi:hypothetical protein